MPDYFEECPKAYPLECWDQNRGIIDVPAWPELAILEFGIVNGSGRRIALFLSYKPSRLCSYLKLLQSPVTELLSLNILDNMVDPDKNGGACEIRVGSREFHIFTGEDRLVGGVDMIEIIDRLEFRDITGEDLD